MTIAGIIALLRVRYPAITNTVASDAYLESWEEWATQIADPSPWGARWPNAMVFLLAHRVRLDGLLGEVGGGPVTSMTTGRRSISWGSPSTGPIDPADAEFYATPEGRSYLSLRATVMDIGLPWAG